MPNTFELIASSTLGSAQSSIDFSSIPATYTDLCLLLSSRDTYNATGLSVFLRFNNNSSAVYSFRRIFGSGSSASSSSDSGRTNNYVGDHPGATATANTFGNIQLYIPNYAGSTAKSYSADAVQEDNTTTAYVNLTAGLSSDTAAINRITLTCQTNFAANSTAYLYGVKNA